MTLITLISKQIWPQVLVAAYLKPSRLVLVHSKDESESFGPAMRFKELLAKHSDFFNSPAVSLLEVPHDRFEEIGSRLEGVIDEPASTSFHITGGNKLMSAAAFEKARLMRRPVVYLEKGNTLFSFQYEGEVRTVKETRLDASICNTLDAADLCACQTGEARLVGRGERLTLNDKGHEVSLSHVCRLIKDVPTLQASKIQPQKWLNVEILTPRDATKGDVLEYATAVVLLKLGIPVVYRSLEFVPARERDDRFKEGELDLVFNYAGSLWVVDCKDKIRQQDKFEKARKALIREGIPQQTAESILQELGAEIEQKDKKILREDLQQILEVGGIQGRIIAVRSTELRPDVEQYARSRRPRIEIVYKNEMESRFRSLLFPETVSALTRLNDL